MPVVDNSTPPPEAQGAAQRQKLLDAGFSTNDVQQWEQGQRQTQMKAGFSPQEMATYWDDTGPTTDKLQNQINANIDEAPEVSDPIGMMEAGWQNSVLGIVQTQGKSSVKANPNAPWYNQLAEGVGEEAGDLPTQIVGGVVGGVAGAAAGAETGPGAILTGAIGAAGGAQGLTSSMREALLQSYNTTGPFTWEKEAASARAIALAAFTGTAVGAVGGAVGGVVGGKVAEATGSKFAGLVSNLGAFSAASTTAQGAIDGKVPSAGDYLQAGILGLGLGVMGHYAGQGASARFQPSPEGLTVAENIQAIYRRTGITPENLTRMMQTDDQVKKEVTDFNTSTGAASTPHIDQYAKAMGLQVPKEFGPKPASQFEPLVPEASASKEVSTGGIEEPQPGYMKPEQVPQVQLDIFRELERSGDDAVSPAGAVGRYQIMPDTARQYGFDPTLLKDPAYNERAARAVLADLNNRFKGNIADMAVAYNAGPARARAWIRGGRDINSLPPETQRYLLHAEEIGAIDNGYVAQHATAALAFQSDTTSDPEHNIDYDVVEPAKPEDYATGGAQEGKEPPWESTPGRMSDEDIKGMGDDDVSRSIDAMVAPRPVLPTWAEKLNLGQLWRGFQFQLTAAHHIDKAMGKTNTEFGIEDALRNTYGTGGRADLFYSKGSVRLAFDEHGNPSYKLEENSPSFIKAYDTVKSDGGTFLGFRRWRLANRTMELNERGIKTGLDPRIAQRYINQPGNFEKYNGGSRVLQAVKDAALDYGVTAGVWSAESAAAMKAMGEDHVVLARAYNRDYTPPNAARSFGVKDPAKAIKGSTKQIIEPETADRDNLNNMVAMADRNVALTYTIDKLRAWNAANPDAQFPIELVKITQVEATREAAAAKATLEGLKTDDGFELPDEFKKAIEPMVSGWELIKSLKAARGLNEPQRDTVLFRNGEPEVWRINDDNLAQLLHATGGNGFDVDPIPLIIQKFASIQRSGITSDFSFPFRAALHGQVAHAILGEGGSHIPWGDMMHGIASVAFGDQIGGHYKGAWDRFVMNGGAHSAASDIDRNMIPDVLSSVFREEKTPGGLPSIVTNLARSPVEAFARMQHIVHTTAQVGSMIAEERKGTPTARASMMARKGYLDYAEPFVGKYLAWWGRFVPFMTTGFKDIQQVTSAFADRPATTAMTVAAGLILPTLLNTYINRLTDQKLAPEDSYTNLPQWLKDNYWVLPPVNGIRFRIPKPYVIGAVASMSERFFNVAWDEMHGDSDQAGRDMDNFVMGMLGRILPPTIPSLPTPVIEQFANRSLYNGAPLVPDKLARLSGYLQYGPNTSKASIAVAGFLHQMGLPSMSPIIMDNYVAQWGGTAPEEFWHALGGSVTQFSPEGLHKLGAYDPAEGQFTDHAPKEAADWPVIGNFIVRNPGAGQIMEDYYDRASKVATAQADLRNAQKANDLPRMREAMKNPLVNVNLSGINAALANMRASAIQANANKNMSDEEKMKITDQLYHEMYLIANSRVRQIDQMLANQK